MEYTTHNNRQIYSLCLQSVLIVFSFGGSKSQALRDRQHAAISTPSFSPAHGRLSRRPVSRDIHSQCLFREFHLDECTRLIFSTLEPPWRYERAKNDQRHSQRTISRDNLLRWLSLRSESCHKQCAKLTIGASIRRIFLELPSHCFGTNARRMNGTPDRLFHEMLRKFSLSCSRRRTKSTAATLGDDWVRENHPGRAKIATNAEQLPGYVTTCHCPFCD